MQRCRVNPNRRESDHHPLEALLALPWIARDRLPATGVPIPRMRWDFQFAAAYSAALLPAALTAVCVAAAADDVTLCHDLLHAEVLRAATEGGMPLRVARPGPAGAPRPAWFDGECRRLRAAVRRCMRRWPDTEATRALVRHYYSVTRRKRRAWALHLAQVLFQELKHNPRSLYRRARPMHLRLPVILQDPAQWSTFVAHLAHGPAQRTPSLLRHLPGQPHGRPDEELGRPFSAEEILNALKRLRNGRSVGASGLPAELLRYALGARRNPDEAPPHLLLPALTAMLNCWLRTGALPAAVNCSLVVPIHKRGDAAQTSNYRPIAVGEPVLRLYATLINIRLVQHTETAGLRAPSQAGFRPRMSTLHPVFTLQHLIDRAAHLKHPLFCCFLDLKGAYDRVPRDLLWQALQRLGVPNTLLGAIQSLYNTAEYAISVGGRRGDSMQSACGVKQGCPLSPTLFGLLLDGLHWALLEGAPGAGPPLACGRRVPDLGYADDFCLLASSAGDLQHLLDAAYRFLTGVGMELSLDKTRIVAFGTASVRVAAGAVWTCGGAVISRVEQYKYLGILFSAKAGIGASFKPLCGRLWAAWALLKQRFGEVLDGLSVVLMRAMFQQAIPPAGSYACEVWGVRHLRGDPKKEREELALTHIQLWRRLLRLAPTVRREVVLRELDVRSPESVWLRSACRFWNTLASAPEDSLQRAVALSDWADATSSGEVHNWAWSLRHRLSDLGYDLRVAERCMERINVDYVLQQHDARELQCWETCDVCPRTCPSEGASLCRYNRWFALPDDARFNAFFRLPLRLGRVFQVIRFRLGCHELPVALLRRPRPKIPRAHRLCLHCDQRAPGDELHLLFECPATQAARAPYAPLFPPGCTMLEFMRHPDSLSVARCILACLAAASG